MPLENRRFITPMMVTSKHTDRWHVTTCRSAKAISRWWNSATASWSTSNELRLPASLLAIFLISSVVSGCVVGTGLKEETLYNKIVSNYDLESEAIHSFYKNDDKGAIEIWTKLVEILLKEKANNESAFYANMRYVDLARLYSNIGWAYLINDDINNARVAYNNAFETLSSGDDGHKKALVASRQAMAEEIQSMKTLATLLSVLGASSQNASIRFSAQMLYNYISTLGPPPDFMAEKRSPKLFEGLDKRTSDGVRINILPSVSPLINIGRLRDSNSSCTVSLIGHGLGLTAAHCVTSGEKTSGTIWGFTEPTELTVFFESVEIPDVVSVRDVIFSVDVQELQGWAFQDWKNDWAILQLTRHPVRRGYLGVIESVSGLEPGDKVIKVGYSSDQSDGRFLSLHWKCNFRGTTENGTVVTDSCRSASGSSGAPLLLASNDGRRFFVYGVNTYSREGAFNLSDSTPISGVAGGGPAVNQFYDTLKSLLSK